MTLGTAISYALELGAEDSYADSEYVRGIAELLALAYLPSVPTGVGRDMIMAAIKSEEW